MTTQQTLSKKTILITGGTGRLGKSFVLKALEHDATVFFTYHQNQKEAQALAAKGAIPYQLDFLDVEKIGSFCTTLKGKIEHLDVLIHNAAAVRDHTLQNLSEEDWDYVMAVDLKAPYYLTKKLMPLLFKKKTARNDNEGASKIFFITSRAAITGGFGISNYAAAKAGLIGLAKSLAQELGKRKILVNAVNPGFMQSRMTENLPQPVLDYQLELSSLHQYSHPEELAEFLVYLSSDRMSQVTGQVFHFESRKL